MSVLRADKISWSYGEKTIFKDLSFKIEKGQFVCFLGTNGTGKSTLLRLLSGIFSPSSGSVYLNEKPVSSLKRREIAGQLAFVSQENSVWLPFTCMETVLMGRYAKSSGWKKSQEDIEIAERCLKDTKTLHLAERKINELSGGELQRVCIAQALAQETPILFLDEPTSHLDICCQIEIMDLLWKLNAERGLTIVIVLHDLNSASQYCSRLMLFNKGCIYADGTPAEVLTSANISEIFGVNADVSSEQRPRIYINSNRDCIKKMV